MGRALIFADSAGIVSNLPNPVPVPKSKEHMPVLWCTTWGTVLTVHCSVFTAALLPYKIAIPRGVWSIINFVTATYKIN